MRAEFLKGHLDFLILAALEHRPAHGYAIVDELRQRSGGVFNLPEGTVYPALHRLEDSDLLSSRWSEVGGRKRRTYRLTTKGYRSLARHRREWAALSQVITLALEATK